MILGAIKKNWRISCLGDKTVFMKMLRHSFSPISNLLDKKHLLAGAPLFLAQIMQFFSRVIIRQLCPVITIIRHIRRSRSWSRRHLSVPHCGSSTTGFGTKAGVGCHGGRTGFESCGSLVWGGWRLESWFRTNENITKLAAASQSRDFR